MFKAEKDMIPVLKSSLSKQYNTVNFVDEFNSGNGIADLVLTTDEIITDVDYVLDYQLVHIILKYFQNRRTKISIEELYSNIQLSKSKRRELDTYLMHRNIAKIIDETYYVLQRYRPPIKKIISIEAKLSDWKGGFYQALRYKIFSHESYLAISAEFAHRVDKELLKMHNIGLIITFPDKAIIEVKSKREKPSNMLANAYLSEKLAYTLSSL